MNRTKLGSVPGFILRFVLMGAVLGVLGGCVSPAQYTKMDDPFKSMSSKAKRPYASAKLCLMLTENTEKAMNHLYEVRNMYANAPFGNSYASEVDTKQRVAELTELLTSRFRETIRVKSLDEVLAHKCNLAIALDIQVQIGTVSFATNSVEISGTFADDKGVRLDTLSGVGKSTVPWPNTSIKFLQAWNQAIASFGDNLDNSKVIASFVAGLPQYVEPGTTMAAQSVVPAIVSDVDTLPLSKIKKNKNAYAIVIGIEQYRQKLPKADFAVNDAKTMTEYLTKVMGYPEENVVTLLDEHATNVDFAKYFEKWLPNNVEKDGSVFIYYSGHGAPNPKTGDAYLVPYDGDPSFIDETGYPLKRLYDSLGKLKAKEIIVALDSCFSGAGGRSVIAKGARPLVMIMESLAIPSKVAVISASSGDQISSSYEEKGHGLFTYFMLKGLKGEAENNGKVEIEDLLNYIKPQVERIARKVYNNEQSPQLIVSKELLEKQKVILIENR